MPELRDATVNVGVPGLNGTGITAGEKTALTNDTTALKAVTYITQTANATLSAEQALSALATGIVKVTTATGVLSTAIAADLPVHTHTQTFGMPFVLDGGGAAIAAGTYYNSGIPVPSACTITSWKIQASSDQTLVTSIQRRPDASITWTTISGTDKPSLTAQTYAPGVGAVTSWTVTSLSAYDSLRIVVDSGTATYVTVTILFSRTI